MRAAQPTTSTLLALHSLIAAVPPERLREIVLTLMLDGAPAPPAEAAPVARRAAKHHRRPRSDRGLKRGPRKVAPIVPERLAKGEIPTAADRAKALALASVDERLAARRERTNAAKRAKRAAAHGNGAGLAAPAAAS
jgi:hypothetical protein